MPGSGAPPVLDRHAAIHAAIPRPRVHEQPIAAADAVAVAPARASLEPAPVKLRMAARRLPRPPSRRGRLWLTALVAGGVLAGVPGVVGDGVEDVTASASDLGLGTANDVGVELEDASIRRGITEAEAQARLGELAASRAARAPKTVLPTHGRLTTSQGMRWGEMHYGIDLAAPSGTPIYSATDGVVIRAGRASGFGYAVYVQDAEGIVHIYGHMRHYSVAAGDIVHAGDQIAKVGSEGFSTGPHLHYELRRGDMRGRPVDPQAWLAEHGIEV